VQAEVETDSDASEGLMSWWRQLSTAACSQFQGIAKAAAVPLSLLGACDVAALPAPDQLVQVYEVRSGGWSQRSAGQLSVGETFLDDGRLLQRTEAGAEVRGAVEVADLADADATWDPDLSLRVPSGADWVLVLGEVGSAGHRRLSEVEPGERFALQGRVFESADVDGDGRIEVRWAGEVLGRVYQTHRRLSDVVIDLTVHGESGDQTITATPEHPFWVEAVGDYVPLSELTIGTRLQAGGEQVRIVDMARREGRVDVFNFEVEGTHNYRVRAPRSRTEGILVHNGCGAAKAGQPHQVDVGGASTVESRTADELTVAALFSAVGSAKLHKSLELRLKIVPPLRWRDGPAPPPLQLPGRLSLPRWFRRFGDRFPGAPRGFTGGYLEVSPTVGTTPKKLHTQRGWRWTVPPPKWRDSFQPKFQ
jgi:hypothetical protein